MHSHGRLCALLAVCRSCVRALVVILFTLVDPAAAMALSRIFTPKLCPFSKRVLWQTTLPVVAPTAGTVHDVAVLPLIPEKLNPLGIGSVNTMHRCHQPKVGYSGGEGYNAIVQHARRRGQEWPADHRLSQSWRRSHRNYLSVPAGRHWV